MKPDSNPIRLTRARGLAYGAGGFTIIELVVSIGILGILMVVAGGVFTLTLKSSGQATAVIEIHQALRALEDSLREDLRFVQPGASVMVIQSHEINVEWTAEIKELNVGGNPLDPTIGSRDPQRERVIVDTSNNEIQQRQPPRADMLMFFTTRPGTSFRDPDVSSRLQQVVWGHALPGELNPATGAWTATLAPPSGTFADRFAESSFPMDQLQKSGSNNYVYSIVPATGGAPPVFPIPARDLHLGRRSVLIVDENLTMAMPAKFPAAWLDDSGAMVSGNEDDPDYSTLQKTFYLRDGRRDILVNGINPFVPEFVYAYHVVNRLKPDPDTSAYLQGDGPNLGPAFDVNYANADSLVSWMPRSQLDTSPPSSQSRRIGQYFMPNCASFKVEWALDLNDVITLFDSDVSFNDECADVKSEFPWSKEILWVDPLNFAETIDSIQSVWNQMDTDTANPICRTTELPRLFELMLSKLIMDHPASFPAIKLKPDRFVQISSSNVIPHDTHVFYPNDPYPAGSATVLDEPDPLFPKALRITVDVFDSAGRLERPIRHVMILPVGQ